MTGEIRSRWILSQHIIFTIYYIVAVPPIKKYHHLCSPCSKRTDKFGILLNDLYTPLTQYLLYIRYYLCSSNFVKSVVANNYFNIRVYLISYLLYIRYYLCSSNVVKSVVANNYFNIRVYLISCLHRMPIVSRLSGHL